MRKKEKEYVVVIFTEFHESVDTGQSLSDLLPDNLKNRECFVITHQATFAALESTEGESAAVIVHEEKPPSKLVKDFIKRKLQTRTVLAGIHMGTPDPVKEAQREWIEQTGGIVREYIHELDAQRSPVWHSFSKLCCDVRRGKKDQFPENYAGLVAALISLPTGLALAIFRHRIGHLFTPIDIDLQGLMASNFRPDYWEKVVAAYRGTNLTSVIDEARRIKEELSEVANEQQKKVIDEKWTEAEAELKRMEPLLCALEKENLDEFKKESDNFRKAFSDFLRILDELDDALRGLDSRPKDVPTENLDR